MTKLARYPNRSGWAKWSVLPVALQYDLEQLGKAGAYGDAVAVPLIAVADGLAGLPLDALVRAGGEIRAHAGLYDRSRNMLRREPADLLRRYETLAYVFICHSDGHWREAALARLDGAAPNAFLFCLAVYALNDWVPQVRAAAHACIIRLADRTDPSVVAEALMYLLQRRQIWLRGRNELAVLDQLAVRPNVFDALVDLLLGPKSRRAHWTLFALLKHPEIDLKLEQLMRDSVQPTVRATAAATLISGVARWPSGIERQWIDKAMGRFRMGTAYETRRIAHHLDQEFLIASAAGDKAVQVRKVAMQALIDTPELWSRRRELISRLSADRSAAIRSGIDYILRHQQEGQ